MLIVSIVILLILFIGFGYVVLDSVKQKNI